MVSAIGKGNFRPLSREEAREDHVGPNDLESLEEKNPHTLVLSTETGYLRDYLQDPYEGYYRSLGIWFPVGDVRKDLSPKEMVLGVEILGTARAYPLSLLRKRPGNLKDEIAGKPIEIEVTPDGEVLEVRDHQGTEIPSIFAYWFAWQAFHPKTTVYKEKKQNTKKTNLNERDN